MIGSRQRKSPFSLSALRYALASCAILSGGLVLSAAPVLAASGEPPTIEGGQIKQVNGQQVNEHDATLEVWIDPHGNETSYTVWLECQSEHEPLLPCEPVANGQLVQGTIPAGLEGVQTIDIELTGLTPGFDYWYAIRAVGAGKLVETTQNLFGIEKHSEAEIPSWYIKQSEEESAQTRREYEARHAKELEALHAKEAEEQRAGEAAKTSEAAALKRQKEEEAAMTGGLIKSKPKTPGELRAEKLAKTLKRCKRDRSRMKRTECEKQARGNYRRLKRKP